jgi:hypothetical protein
MFRVHGDWVEDHRDFGLKPLWEQRAPDGAFLKASCNRSVVSRGPCRWLDERNIERQVAAFVDHYNQALYHESSAISLRLTSTSAGPRPSCSNARNKRQTIANRRLQHQLRAA